MTVHVDDTGRDRARGHFVWGENDPFGGPATGRALLNSLPNATLEVLPAAGHAPWLDDLEHCVAAVRRHLTGEAAPSMAGR